MKKIFKNQRGDTIVEVLISIAVVSLVLSASYALANRSTQATRQSQERSEALKFAEEQMEKVKTYLSISGSDDIISDDFCITGAGASLNVTNVASDPNACSKGPDNRYRMAVDVDGDTYRVSSTWDSIGGGQDNLELVYRIPETTFSNVYTPPATPPPVDPMTDTDNDGVVDSDDSCPTLAGGSNNIDGCPVVLTDNGSGGTCTPYQAGAPCVNTGQSVHSCGNYSVRYPTTLSLASGTYKLRINYQDAFCQGSTIAAPPLSSGYKYKLRVEIIPRFSTTDILGEYTVEASPGTGFVDVNVPDLSPGDRVVITWTNNEWVANGSNPYGYDPDFQIDSINYIRTQ